VLDPVIGALASHLGRQSRGLPGQQHLLDNEYFARIDAMTFALNHDDGQSSWGLNDADVVLVGVSRTSKTPTCIYLANRGIKAANVPIVPGVALPPELGEAKRPLVVGLTNDPERLIQVRRNRLSMLHQDESTDYTDIEAVRSEVQQARRLFAQNHWPVIDVSRRSIEETAASILKLLARRHGTEE
jgi:regulator of PEP synthase PpsR (kinase-PPPase family)